MFCLRYRDRVRPSSPLNGVQPLQSPSSVYPLNVDRRLSKVSTGSPTQKVGLMLERGGGTRKGGQGKSSAAVDVAKPSPCLLPLARANRASSGLVCVVAVCVYTKYVSRKAGTKGGKGGFLRRSLPMNSIGALLHASSCSPYVVFQVK